MAKIKPQYPQPPYEIVWYTMVFHNYYQLGDPLCEHAIYAYWLYHAPEPAGAYKWHPTYEEALLEARSWAAMPQIPRDLCVYCRNLDYGPNTPRWNIYRGEDRMIVPMTFFGEPYWA
jgi:hypothetical protein